MEGEFSCTMKKYNHLKRNRANHETQETMPIQGLTFQVTIGVYL